MENNGKMLVVGMYLDTILVFDPNAPIIVTFLELFDAKNVGLFHTTVQLAGPEGDIGDLLKIDFEVKAPGTVAGILKVPLKFTSSGTYFLRGRIEESGERYEKTFSVTMATPNTPREADQ
jgi:hypothetical protein